MIVEQARLAVGTAVRDHLRRPLLSGAIVLTLAMAIGMNAAIFDLVDRAILSAPPTLRDAASLHALTFRAPGQPAGAGAMTTTSFVAYRIVREDVPAAEGALAWRAGPASVTVAGQPIPADTLLVSANYFDVLGSVPLRGRGLSGADGGGSASPIVVLSYRFWHSAFGGADDVLDRHLTVRGIEYAVAGVMPRGFSGHSVAEVDVWIPIEIAARAEGGWDGDAFRNVVSIVVRERNGATPETLAAQAGAALNREVALATLAGAAVSASVRRMALWLGMLAVLLYAIGVANAATLMLVRAARRRHDWMVRTALGASRGRLLTQVAVDALLIALAAAAAAALLGGWLEEAVRRVLLPDVAPAAALSMRTATVIALASVGAAAALIVAGALSMPARLGAGLRIESGSTRGLRFQHSLLLAQTAICVLLLAAAGMVSSSLWRLLRQDFGMRLENVVLLHFEDEADQEQHPELLSAALERIKALPGVAQATTYQTLPFRGHHVPPISVPGRAEPPSVGGQWPFLIAATPELFDILDIRIVDGRSFSRDDARGPLVVIVNETMARELWPQERAVGKCVRAGFDPAWDPETAGGPPTASTALPCRTVVGVARDVRQRQVVPVGNEHRLMQYYVPPSQVPGPPAGIPDGPSVRGLLVRTSSDSAALMPAMRRLVGGGRADAPAVLVRPYEDVLEGQVEPWRVGASLLTIFSALAIAVGMLGIYAAFAHAVSVRRREMAIRVAIGAHPASVTRMVLGEASRLAAIGIGAGIVGAIWAGRSLQTVLFGIKATDPLVLGGAAAAMLLVVIVATAVPAVRAGAANPVTLLRD